MIIYFFYVSMRQVLGVGDTQNTIHISAYKYYMYIVQCTIQFTYNPIILLFLLISGEPN